MADRPLILLDYMVIAAFFAVMVGVGVYYSRKSKDSDQFFGGDKTMPWWLSGVSFYLCTVSALEFVIRTAQGADDLLNLTNKMFAVFVCPIALPMLAGFVIRRLSRRAGFCGLAVGMAVSLAAFVAGGWHPDLREMTVMTPISFAATVAGLWAGTLAFPDSPEERRTVEAFFRKAETPA